MDSGRPSPQSIPHTSEILLFRLAVERSAESGGVITKAGSGVNERQENRGNGLSRRLSPQTVGRLVHFGVQLRLLPRDGIFFQTHRRTDIPLKLRVVSE